jgi:hypothetical protein
MQALAAAGAGICAETRNPGSRCLHRSHLITPDMKLELCHNRATGQVIGLGHQRCNRAEGAREARRRQGRNSGRGIKTATRQSRLQW